MATKYWVGGNGGAADVKQAATATFGVYDAATTRTITIGGVAVSAVDSGGTLTNALSALATALNASLHPYFAAIDWTSSATQIIGTAATAGCPFVFAGSVSGGTGTVTNAYTVTTANQSGYDWSVAGNWSGNALPANGDTCVLDGASSYAIAFGLSTGGYFNIRCDQPETATVGLGLNFTTDVAGATVSSPVVREYRTAALTLSGSTQAITITLGREFGPNSSAGIGRFYIDTGDTAPTFNIYNSASVPTDSGLMPIQVTGSNAYAILNLRSGLVGVGIRGETTSIASVTVADPSGRSRVNFGDGVSCPAFTCNGGTHSIITSTSIVVTNNGGTLQIEGSTTLLTLNCNAGTTYLNGSATVTAANVQNNAVLDCTKSGRSFTITTLTLAVGSSFRYSNLQTITNQIVVTPAGQPRTLQLTA